MKRTLFPLLIALSVLIFGACEPSDDCGNGELEFQLPLKAYGIKDTLHPGDTIRIRLDIPDRMPERNSGISYDFPDYNFMLVTYIVKIDDAVSTTPPDAFDWLTTEGESAYLNGVYQVIPDYHDNVYHYEMFIIAREKGLYVFGMNSDAGRLNSLEKLEGPCSRRPVQVYTQLLNDPNTNFEFLKLSPDPVQANTSRQRFDEYGGFCFFVR